MNKDNRSTAGKLICDEMLGSLSRWLRLAGYDVLYLRDMSDAQILRVAVDEGRSVLTRDRELSRRLGARSIMITELTLDGQLEELSNLIELERSAGCPSRCTICNGILKAVRRGDLSKEDERVIPPRALEGRDIYYKCEICGHFYWRGTHIKGIEERLSRYGMVFSLPDREQNIL